jgi:uncharacterized caspase-like protein
MRPRVASPTVLPILALSVLALALTAAAGERYALVVGIDGYQTLGKLETCVADAEGLRQVLVERAGFSEKRVALLTDKQAEQQNRPTLAMLRERIRQVCSFAEQGDTVLIFFSGHGDMADAKSGEKKGYLIPLDGGTTLDEQGEMENAIPLSWLKQRLEECKATHKVLILDTCHAGSATLGVGGVAGSLTSAVLLLSCGEKQVSHTDKDRGHSVFSQFLIEGLAGAADADKNKEITVAELFGFVKDRMKDWGMATGKTQTPLLSGEKAEAFAVARVPSDRPSEPRVEQPRPELLPKHEELPRHEEPPRHEVRPPR